MFKLFNIDMVNDIRQEQDDDLDTFRATVGGTAVVYSLEVITGYRVGLHVVVQSTGRPIQYNSPITEEERIFHMALGTKLHRCQQAVSEQHRQDSAHLFEEA